MTDKRLLWAKAWRKHWRDEKSLGLDMCATLLRQFLAQHVGQVGEDGTGWSMTEGGKPWPLFMLAAACKGTAEQVDAALIQLTAAEVIIERDGMYGTVGWTLDQETPDATRMRRVRTNERTVRPRVRPKPGETPNEPANSSLQEGQKDRGAEGQNNTLPYTAGGREVEVPTLAAADLDGQNHSAQSNPTADAVTGPIGRRLEAARLAVFATTATAAPAAGMAQGRLKNLEAGVLLPTPDDLQRLARAYGQPEISAWPVPVRDLELVAAVVMLHHDRAVELGAKAPGSPATATPLLAASVYATEADDLATGLTLRQAWERVITRGAEELRRDIARGKTDQIRWFELQFLAGVTRRARLLAAADLDRRDDGRPGRRGPPPPQNPDRLPDGEIPQ